jgi:3-dehydroquinate synthase
MKRVRVAAGRAPYDVIIGRGAVSPRRLRSGLGQSGAGVVVSSAKVMALHGRTLRGALDGAGFDIRRTILLPDGESAKSASAWERTLRAMAKSRLDRTSFVIAFGGGSIGDAAGFAAATYMRGIRLIQIPTTLLSMVDSSVGGKTGINLAEGKNLVGSFHQPSLVLADLSFLKTLPGRERQSGVYEIVKCGLLRSRSLLTLIERTRGLSKAADRDLESAIAGAVQIKARIVERDERESGERALLNLGHTLGHALEAATSYRRFTHGEAVGYGMEFAVDLGEALGLTEAEAATRMREAVLSVGRKTPLDSSGIAATRAAMLGDKKRAGRALKEILLHGPQRPILHLMDAEALAHLASAWLRAKAKGRG